MSIIASIKQMWFLFRELRKVDTRYIPKKSSTFDKANDVSNSVL